MLSGRWKSPPPAGIDAPPPVAADMPTAVTPKLAKPDLPPCWVELSADEAALAEAFDAQLPGGLTGIPIWTTTPSIKLRTFWRPS